ncbi:hypothetical protein FOXB_16234, partial [Fusarium oxysporum f. sp. conglutinans Fo5176]
RNRYKQINALGPEP